MLTEDYVLRQLSLAAAALIQAIGLRKTNHLNQSEQTIQQALEQLTGMPNTLLNQIDDWSLLEALSTPGVIEVDRGLLLADLLREQGTIYQVQGRVIEACASTLRALFLLLEISFQAQVADFNNTVDRVEALINNLDVCTIPFDLQFSLFSYYELVSEYTKAEFYLHGLIARDSSRIELKQEYLDYCTRLLALPDTTLEQAGISHIQIDEWLIWINNHST